MTIPGPSPAALEGLGGFGHPPFSDAGAIKQQWGRGAEAVVRVKGRGCQVHLSTMVVGVVGGGSQGQTHSCKERLQYKSIRGAPFLCIWTMT